MIKRLKSNKCDTRDGEAVMNIQQVKTIIADAMEKHNGIVKKEELTRLGIDYRRIDTLVREGSLSASETAITPTAWMIFLRMHLSRHSFRMQCFAWKVHFTPMAI